MAQPTLTPASSTPTNILPSASLASSAFTFSYPFGIYGSGGPLESQYFASGASDQVAFTYKKLGGDVLDIELTEDMNEADIVLGLKSHLKDNLLLVLSAKKLGIPIYSIQKNTMPQITQILSDISS